MHKTTIIVHKEGYFMMYQENINIIQKLPEPKTDRTNGKYRQLNKNSWRFQTPVSLMCKTTRKQKTLPTLQTN